MNAAQIASARTQTRQFGDHYDYDVTYMEEMLDASPAGFDRFQAVLGMSSFRDVLPVEVAYIVKVAAFSVVDCGPCLELNLKMAREAGVDAELLRLAVRDPDRLPPELAEAHGYAAQIAAGATPELAQVARLRERYGSAGLVEISLGIASALVFPAVKRTLGHARSCSLTPLSV